jgi:hypothetical protein
VDVDAGQLVGREPADFTGLVVGRGRSVDRPSEEDDFVLLAGLAVGVGDDVSRVGEDPQQTSGRDQDPGLLIRALGEPDRPDGRQADVLQVEEGVVLAAGDLQRLFLERVERAVDDDEADEVARRADRQLAEDDLVRPPGAERQLPRKAEEALRRLPEPETGERCPAQRRFRR